MIIERDIRHELKKLVESYPVVTITGPRQAGKTTLAKMEYPQYQYCNLESPEIRNLAADDPNAFFHQFKYPLIIDEIQRYPNCYHISRLWSMKKVCSFSPERRASIPYF
jgi:hypothetical protein